MKFIARYKVAPPVVLMRPNERGDRERRRAKVHFDAGNTDKFKYEVYKDQEVKDILEKLFHEKCAYCEWKYAAGASVEIEHYRPKGGVEREDDHGGYWWLAADWDNLLPVCSHCNTWKEQVRYLKDSNGIYSPTSAFSGKGTAFPIRGVRAISRACNHDKEDPLIIDPTRKDPRWHMRFTLLHGVSSPTSIVTPTHAGGSLDIYGDTTIDILGLNRRVLVEARSTVLLEVAMRIRMLRKLISMALKNKPTKEDVKSINDEVISLLHFGKAERHFAAAADAYVKEQLQGMKAELEKLK